ncbi:hypothetical protein D7X55_37325 [Corallococcus sp. AB049A]|uniref:Uncharacterized protein n=1 Tax=Corallococcus interemptor TaxID=2316720 RepID=A0A3A8QHT3_9BACT|nr:MULTISPECIES: hypothetical protein [Corallococcus]RKH68147.1 hypothetical protein D7X96_17780 [Corallococcus interemptor]RKI45972.1 hypothetical protein D7X55_37325 [Corallococcus sp. AB049A]
MQKQVQSRQALWAWHCILLSGAWFWMSSASPAASEAQPRPLFARLRRGMTRAEAEALVQGATLGGYPAKATYWFSPDERLEDIGLSVFHREARCASALKAIHDEMTSAFGASTPSTEDGGAEGKQCETWRLSDSSLRICCKQHRPADGGTGWMILTAAQSFSPHKMIDITNGFH